jgi:transcriptional regulator with XRE-family HTH domain
MSFGNRVKKIRKQKGVSQSTLANALGISTNAISQYETDKRFPDKKTLVEICNFLDVSSDYLLGLSEIPHPSPALKKLAKEFERYNDEQIDALNTFITNFNRKKL